MTFGRKSYGISLKLIDCPELRALEGIKYVHPGYSGQKAEFIERDGKWFMRFSYGNSTKEFPAHLVRSLEIRDTTDDVIVA